MTDIVKENNNSNPVEDAPAPQPTLDELHEATVDEVKEEDAKAVPAEGEAEESEEDPKPPVEPEKPVVPEPAPEDKPTDPAPEPAKEDPKPEPAPAKPVAPAVPTVDPSKYKVKFVDFAGKEHLVNSADELPDDFEPKNYKDFARSTQELTYKQAEYRQDVAKANATKIYAEREDRIGKIQQGWDTDIDRLSKSGALPKEETERKKVVEGVFEVIEESLKAGQPLDSFAYAYEIYQNRQTAAEAKARQEQTIKNKKTRGAMIQGSSNSNRGSAIVAPPTGMSLDDVHDQVVSSLS